jgi:RHS repeat-associated protein
MVVVAKQHNRFGTDDSLYANLLYRGDEYSRDDQVLYLRARYYSPDTGRFSKLDPFAGNHEDPLSLHKYAYTHNDPINGFDPSGRNLTLIGLGGAAAAVAGAYFLLSFLKKATTWYLEVASALGDALGGNPQGTYFSPTANMPVSVPPSDPNKVRVQNRLDYLHRLRRALISAGDDLIIGNSRGYSTPGMPPLNREEWRQLKAALDYARHYDASYDVAIVSGDTSFNNPTWPGITLAQNTFYGRDWEALEDLVHEPMHNLFYHGLGHSQISRVVGPYSGRNNYYGELQLYLEQSTRNGTSWWDDLKSESKR